MREAVLDLRRGKGMVVDAADPDTWSAGSFFTNPVLDPAALAAFEARLEPGTSYPSWPATGGRKLSAAWLIERAGFAKGYGAGPVRISTKHTLALTHRGGGRRRRPGRAGPRGPRRRGDAVRRRAAAGAAPGGRGAVSAVAADQRELGGLVGWVLDVIEALLFGVIGGRRVRRRRAGLDPVTGQLRRR